jgi:hypothetical protein
MWSVLKFDVLKATVLDVISTVIPPLMMDFDGTNTVAPEVVDISPCGKA